MLRFRGTEGKRPMRFVVRCQNGAYLAAIAILKLQLRATTGGRVAIWEIA